MRGVYVGWIDGGDCDSGFAESLVGLTVAGTLNGTVKGWLHHVSGPVLSLARNTLAEKFLRTDGEWLLSIDSDMVFQADLADRLLQSADPEERPIVGALCYGMVQEIGMFPAIFRLVNGWPGIILEPPEDTLIRVDACGAACLLTHRSVFEKMRGIEIGRWYDPLYVGERPLGEDMSFCLRAGRAGLPIWVDTGADVKHVKVKFALDHEMYRKWRAEHPVKGGV